MTEISTVTDAFTPNKHVYTQQTRLLLRYVVLVYIIVGEISIYVTYTHTA